MYSKRVILIGLAACSSNTVAHIPDAPGGGSGGMVEPCAIMASSSMITGNTGSTGGSCTPSLVNNTTLAIDWVATDASGSNNATCEMSCTIMPGVVPQTLGFRTGTTGCNVEIDYHAANNGILDSWDGTASDTIEVTVTDLATVSGTIHIAIADDSNDTSSAMSVTGTF